MTTFEVELPDDLAKRIQNESERSGIRVAELIQKAVRQVYAKPLTMTGLPPGRIQSTEEALKSSLEENEELYRRLAQ